MLSLYDQGNKAIDRLSWMEKYAARILSGVVSLEIQRLCALYQSSSVPPNAFLRNQNKQKSLACNFCKKELTKPWGQEWQMNKKIKIGYPIQPCLFKNLS